MKIYGILEGISEKRYRNEARLVIATAWNFLRQEYLNPLPEPIFAFFLGLLHCGSNICPLSNYPLLDIELFRNILEEYKENNELYILVWRNLNEMLINRIFNTTNVIDIKKLNLCRYLYGYLVKVFNYVYGEA